MLRAELEMGLGLRERAAVWVLGELPGLWDSLTELKNRTVDMPQMLAKAHLFEL
jgi:hypothetical protein